MEPTAAQLLLVAEECLARGQPDKAAELGAQAIGLRPESLEAKALVNRARRQLARQRRRGRQEERLKEAAGLLETGNVAGAEALVASVLKRMPGHPEALALFGRVKGRRLAKGDAEAQAEHELAQMGQGQARRAAEAARSAQAAGWHRKALLALRRGLRLVPDDPELLELLRQTQRSLGEQERTGSRQRAAGAQVREALDRLKEGRLKESLHLLRSLLRQDPDHQRAQAAVQEVRRAWLARAPAPAPPAVAGPPSPARPVPSPAPASPTAPAPSEAVRSPLVPAPSPPAAASRPSLLGPEEVRRRLAAGAAIVPPAAPVPAAPAVRREPPPEIALPRRPKGTPLLLVFGSAALVIALLLVLTSRPSGHPAPVAAAPTARLAAVDPDVRAAVETTLAGYARALESQDAELLARVRPDLRGAERERLLARFRGAINVATDLRVLDVIPGKGVVVVPVLRTDVIVGGRGAPTAPVEETLRFERRDGVWRLAGAGR
ncbi:MAG: hypothetical protein DMF80_01095 [Acidobacteria bacterium]|nr:MAG: hypothetical protein DMF80_01095 [Acidobacteriota bacterium]